MGKNKKNKKKKKRNSGKNAHKDKTQESRGKSLKRQHSPLSSQRSGGETGIELSSHGNPKRQKCLDHSDQSNEKSAGQASYAETSQRGEFSGTGRVATRASGSGSAGETFGWVNQRGPTRQYQVL